MISKIAFIMVEPNFPITTAPKEDIWCVLLSESDLKTSSSAAIQIDNCICVLIPLTTHDFMMLFLVNYWGEFTSRRLACSRKLLGDFMFTPDFMFMLRYIVGKTLAPILPTLSHELVVFWGSRLGGFLAV